MQLIEAVADSGKQPSPTVSSYTYKSAIRKEDWYLEKQFTAAAVPACSSVDASSGH